MGSFKGIPTDKILSHTPFLKPPSHSHLLLAPFFARSLTLVPRSLLRNPRKRMLRKLLTGATDGLLSITRGGSRIPFFLKEIKVCIVPFLWPKRSIRGTREALFTG